MSSLTYFNNCTVANFQTLTMIPNLCVPKETHSMWDFFNVTLGRYYQYLFGLKRKQIDLCLFDQQLCNVISHRDSFYGNEWDQSRLWSQGCFWRNRLLSIDRCSPFIYQWVEENWYWKSKVSKWQIFPSRILPRYCAEKNVDWWKIMPVWVGYCHLSWLPRACFQKYTYPSVRPGRWKEEGVFLLWIPSTAFFGHQTLQGAVYIFRLH